MEHAGATTGDWMTRLEAEERRCLWAPLVLLPFLGQSCRISFLASEEPTHACVIVFCIAFGGA